MLHVQQLVLATGYSGSHMEATAHKIIEYMYSTHAQGTYAYKYSDLPLCRHSLPVPLCIGLSIDRPVYYAFKFITLQQIKLSEAKVSSDIATVTRNN